MIRQIKNIVIAVLLLALVGVSIWAYRMSSSFFEKKEDLAVSVVLEKMERVFKLVTVEGHLSEIYDYKDYYTFDVSPFRKKALVRVNGKVVAGYDFNNLAYTIDEASRTIRIDSFPSAEILYIDHDLDYYDITEGSFNSFTKEDYNQIQKSAKKFLSNKAIDAKILESSEKQKSELIDMLRMLLEAANWKLEIRDADKSTTNPL